MAITAVCPSCGRRFQAPDTFGGKRVKCKSCGTPFQITSGVSTIDDLGETDIDALAEMERSAAGIASADATRSGRIRKRDEVHLPGNSEAEEFVVRGPAVITQRANYLLFRYPGARQIDHWLPLLLLLAGFGILAAIVSGQDTAGVAWIAGLRFAIPSLLFYAIIFPLTLTGLNKAGAELNYRPPPNPKLRAFAIYLPAFVLACGFWMTGDGSIAALVLGTVIGLLAASGLLWLLYRLKEEELAISVAYGASGFLTGLAITVGLVFGLNALTVFVMGKSNAPYSVPASPFGPGLAWISPPPAAAPTPAVAKKPTVAVISVPTPPPATMASNSAIVSNVALDQLPADTIASTGPIANVIFPLKNAPFAALLHQPADKPATIDAWNTTSWQKIGTELSLATAPKQFALALDGQRLAYVDRFPRLCVKVWSFTTGSVVKRLDLDATEGEPRLLGFCAEDRLVVHWIAATDLEAKQAPWHVEVLDTDSQRRVTAFTTPPLENSAAVASISTTLQKLVVAAKNNGTPSLLQYPLDVDGKPPTATTIAEVDPTIAVSPTGLGYSPDGRRMAVLFEYGGGAVMPVYNTDSGTEIYDSEFTVWPPHGVTTTAFTGNAISWLQGRDAILLYGQAIIDALHGKVVGTLDVASVNSARVVSAEQVELIADLASAKRIVSVKLNADKLDTLVPLAATQPESSTTAPTPTTVPLATTVPTASTEPVATPSALFPDSGMAR